MNFISTDNITLIWKVISQTCQISREQINTSMNEYYKNKNINYVLSKEQLTNVNKAYITYFKKMIKNPINNNRLNESFHNENTFPIEYTFEEIQNKKREKFNEELNQKQKEFSSFNQVIIPPPLKFNEDIDKPISEMEQLIAKTIAERTLDIESIHKKMEPPPPPIKLKIEKSNMNLEEKHISWKDELPLDDFSLKEKMNQIDKKLNLIIELLNNNKN